MRELLPARRIPLHRADVKNARARRDIAFSFPLPARSSGLARATRRDAPAVRHQRRIPEDLSQTPSDTVRKLGDRIKECPLLVHIVGHDPGWTANPDAVADLIDGIPADQFMTRFPARRFHWHHISGSNPAFLTKRSR